jgi:dynein heavy chain
MFGGHHDPKTRLNDTWFFNIKEMEWRRVGSEKNNTENLASTIGAPSPRANTGAIILNDKVYLFGGHGGLNYSRIALKDLYCFDLKEEVWEEIHPANAGPDGRGGHSVFAAGEKIYIYGGWNNEMMFNNIWFYDLSTNEWTDPDIYNGTPRWNHSSVLVPAIPTWKFFIFGGEQAEYVEGADRKFGQYANSSCYLDMGTTQWTTFASDPATYSNMPTPREYAGMTYDNRESRLVVFGGWNNGWMDDMYSLNVAKIVGPSYAITASEPSLGQLSGKSKLIISGQGFKEPNIKVIFTNGNRPVDSMTKISKEVSAEFVSATQISCLTPNFEEFGPNECVMQVSIAGGDYTTTWIPFHYFLNTRALKSLAYGPGVLGNVMVGQPVEFVIQARNDLNENRVSGNDEWEV